MRAGAAGVDKVDVIDLQVGSPGPQRSSEVVVGGVILALALCDGNGVRCKATCIGGLSVDGQS